MSWTDKQIDDLYRKSANGLSFEYKGEYWAEMSSQLPASNVAPIIQSDAQIDNMYQESVGETSFAYKPEYWHAMEAMLPQKRRPDFLWFFASVLFLGIFATAPFISKDFEETGNLQTAETKVVDQKTKGITITDDIREREDNENSALNDSDNQVGNNTTDRMNSSSTNVNNGGAENGTASNVNQSNSSPASNAQSVEASGNNHLNKQNVSPGVELNPTGLVDVVLAGHPGVIDGKQEYLDVDRLATNGLEETVSRSLVNYPIVPYKVKSNIMAYGQIFGGLSQSLITPSEDLSYSYGIGAGIEIQKKNWSLTAGVNGLISNHNDLELNRTAKVYGFGSDIYQFKVDYQQLYTLEANLELGYEFKRHRFKLGVRPSYTFSSRVRVNETGEENITQGVVNKTSADRSIYGYMGGVNRLGIKPMAGYGFKLTPTMELGFNIGMQFMPMVNEDFIDGINNKLPIDGQLYFKKTISFK